MPAELLKRCATCLKSKPLVAFGQCARTKDGLQKQCRSCRKEASAAYYTAHRDKILAAQKTYYATHKEACLARSAAWAAAHPEKFRAYYKVYRARQKEDDHAQQKQQPAD